MRWRCTHLVSGVCVIQRSRYQFDPRKSDKPDLAYDQGITKGHLRRLREHKRAPGHSTSTTCPADTQRPSNRLVILRGSPILDYDSQFRHGSSPS